MTARPLRAVYDAIGRSDWSRAQAQCRRLLRQGVETAAVHHALGISLCGGGAYDQAVGPFARAVELDPVTPAWARDAGALYAKLGRWAEARAVLARVVDGLDAEGLNVFLTAATETFHASEAVGLLTRAAIDTLHEDPDSLCAYGRALLAASRCAEAEAVLLECLKRFPNASDACEELARAYDRVWDRDRGLQQWRRLAETQPDRPRAHLKLAVALGDRGQWEDSRRVRQHAESLPMTAPEEYASRVYMMLSDPEETSETILQAARGAFTGLSISQTKRRRQRRSSDRIRVGYLTSSFHGTPSYYFTSPFLTNHDRSRLEVFLYSPRIAPGAATSHATLGEHYREVDLEDDARLHSVLRADKLDVLVHMAGHFSYSGLRLMCRRIAPLQICYPNFPSTTGCPGIDYVITDRWLSPKGTEREYSERLYRIPSGSLVFSPPENGPRIAPPPLLTNLRPTFGIVQRLAKFNAPFCDAVAAVLKRVPEAHLVIHTGDLELDHPGSSTSRLLRQRFETRGIDSDRVSLKGPLPYDEHLAFISQIDVSLDTFPYTGQTTTCESLWMGIPVVTMKSGTHVSRVSGAILTRAGYPRWVAKTMDEYVEIAARLVGDAEELRSLRQRLRADVVNAGITDGATLARALEGAYEEMDARR